MSGPADETEVDARPGAPSASLPRILVLADSWLPDGWGPFHASLARLLQRIGSDVLLVRTNSFLAPMSSVPLSMWHLAALRHAVREYRPDLVFSINRCGLSPGVTETLGDVPILSLFIDYYDRVPVELRQFSGNDVIWGTGTGRIREGFLAKYGDTLRDDQTIFTLWGSDTTVFRPDGRERDKDISFIGTAFGHAALVDLINAIRVDPEALRIFLDVYFAHRTGHLADLSAELVERGLDPAAFDPIVREVLERNEALQSIFADQISTEERTHYLAALADLDLRVYGDPERSWIDVILAVDARLLRRYSFRPVSAADELPAIYLSSKIGLNIQHHHASDAGLSFRVFDVMASEALLVTQGITRIPLAELGFEADRDYVAFDSAEELRGTVAELLRDDAARIAIAESGRRLVHEHHSVAARFAAVLEFMGRDDLARRVVDVDAAPAPARSIFDAGAIEIPRSRLAWLPRTPRQVHHLIGNALPNNVVDVRRRLYHDWWLTMSLGRGRR